jgi:acetyl-CoA C-acetyltransferase
MSNEAWIIDAVRSPRGKGKESGALHPIHPQRILAQVLNALQARNGFDTADVDDVVMGCGAGSGDHSMDIARMAALDAGWSIDAPGVTLNRFCGSGQQAVNFGAMGVLAGFQDLVVTGGVESMSRPSPMHVDGFTANNTHLRDQYDTSPEAGRTSVISHAGTFNNNIATMNAGVAVLGDVYTNDVAEAHFARGDRREDHHDVRLLHRAHTRPPKGPADPPA